MCRPQFIELLLEPSHFPLMAFFQLTEFELVMFLDALDLALQLFNLIDNRGLRRRLDRKRGAR
jgi:hypothetical protein